MNISVVLLPPLPFPSLRNCKSWIGNSFSFGKAPSELSHFYIVFLGIDYGSWKEIQLDEGVDGISYILGKIKNWLEVTN
jgi:hypothetical protein